VRSFDGRTAATGSLVATLVAVVVSSRFPAGVSLVVGLTLAGALMLMIDITSTRQRRECAQRPDASARAAASSRIEPWKLLFAGLRVDKRPPPRSEIPRPSAVVEVSASPPAGTIPKAQNAAGSPSAAANDRDAEEYEDDYEDGDPSGDGWEGIISFGMVNIPVRLQAATVPQSSFHQLCGEHMTPLESKLWCPAGDHEVRYSDIVRGYQITPDNYVVLDDVDLENIPRPSTRAVEILEFVPSEDIDAALYFKSAYRMEPLATGIRAYHLLRQALKETGMVAIATVAFAEREHLSVLQPRQHENLLMMNTLYWPDELRPAEGLQVGDDDLELGVKELQMAKSLVQSLAEDTFDPSRYQDEYHEALMKVVNAKVAGQQVVSRPEVGPEPIVMNLMEALQASIDQAKRARDMPARNQRPARTQRPARKRDVG
jgi:DNA end-binding protein Ku